MPRISGKHFPESVSVEAVENAPDVTVGERIVPWRPHAGPQAALLSCPVKDVLYGGARGGGKSAGLLMDFAAHAQRYAKGASGILFRRSYPELEDLERQAREFYGPLGWAWKAASRTWVAPNGAVVKLRFMEKDSDAGSYIGHEYSWMAFDQAESWATSRGIDVLAATLRSSKGVPCTRRLAANPGGPGHQWLKKRYVSPAKPMTPFTSETGWRAVYIPATLDDNPSLPGEYEETVKAATFGNEALWQAWRHGSWDVIAGAAFAEWDATVHTMASHVIPAWWERVAGLDWGYRKGAAVYCAFSPDDRIEVVSDLILERLDAETAGERCAEAWLPLGLPSWIVSSPDMWTGTGAGKTLAERFREGWAKVVPGGTCPLMEGDQKPGQRRVKKILTHEALRWTNDRNAKGEVEPWAMPRLRFHQTARYLIETIPALPVDPDRPEDDILTTADDHGYDALGFVLAIRPEKSRESDGRVKPKDDVQGPLHFQHENPAGIQREPLFGKGRMRIRVPRPHEKKGLTLNLDGL